ncbi:hypothetical protein [Dactylosporangium sp. NPDC005555]|uniref:hypothetical protein n=1 Tax=Dactylosporangium sp. NPDC005555 TaxID=3154889 RepID=UPI0033A2099D
MVVTATACAMVAEFRPHTAIAEWVTDLPPTPRRCEPLLTFLDPSLRLPNVKRASEVSALEERAIDLGIAGHSIRYIARVSIGLSDVGRPPMEIISEVSIDSGTVDERLGDEAYLLVVASVNLDRLENVALVPAMKRSTYQAPESDPSVLTRF